MLILLFCDHKLLKTLKYCFVCQWIVISWCSGVVHCLSLPEIDPTGPIYVVNRCPDVRGIDDVTRRRCEAESGSNVNLQLAKLPVVGVNTGILYRNAFCAACNSERDQRYVFWVAKLELCSRNFTSSHELRYELRTNHRFVGVATTC